MAVAGEKELKGRLHFDGRTLFFISYVFRFDVNALTIRVAHDLLCVLVTTRMKRNLYVAWSFAKQR